MREYVPYNRADLEAVKEESIFIRTPINELEEKFSGVEDQQAKIMVNECENELDELIRLLRDGAKAKSAINHAANNYHSLIVQKTTNTQTPFIPAGGEKLIARQKAEELALVAN